MYFFVFMCLVLTINQQYAAGSPTTRYEYIEEADAFLRLHIVPATWQDAGLRCYLEGGILASPTTSAMAAAMTAMMKAHKLFTRSVFTGIHDHSSKGEFVSLDGVPLADMSLEWAEGQPDNVDNGEDCLALTAAGALADVSCGSVHPYFCRIKTNTVITGNGEMTDYWMPEATAKSPYMSFYELGPEYVQSEGSDTQSDSSDIQSDGSKIQSDSLDIDKCGTTDYEWDARTGSCYRFHRSSKSWIRALRTCHAEGGHLAIINSDTESEVLREYYQIYHEEVSGATNSNFASIGVWKMIDHDTKWMTIHGDTLEEAGFERWQEGEPNNWDGNENCGGVSPDGLLNDLPCGNEYQFPFFCEITP